MRFIYFGGYPGGAKLTSSQTRWRRYIKDSIIAPAIERDVLMTKVIYKPQLMKQLSKSRAAREQQMRACQSSTADSAPKAPLS